MPRAFLSPEGHPDEPATGAGDTRSPAGRRLVLGIGNPARRDDGVGPAVAARLGALRGVEIRTLVGDAAAILDAWKDAGSVWIVDAVAGSGLPPGRWRRLEGHDLESGLLASPAAAASVHGLGVAEAIAFGRALGRLPRRIVVYAVEGADFGWGEGLDPAVEHGVREVAAALMAELAAR